jgi:hypothetical protein
MMMKLVVLMRILKVMILAVFQFEMPNQAKQPTMNRDDDAVAR